MRTSRRFAISSPLRPAPLAALGVLTALTASAAYAQALPPAPYQTNQNAGQTPYGQAAYGGSSLYGGPPGVYGGPQAMDRYGGGMRPPSSYGSSYNGDAPQASGPRLAWAGKVEASAPQAAQSGRTGDWSSMSQRWAAQNTGQNAGPANYTPQGFAPQGYPQAQTVPQDGWRPYRPQQAAYQPQPQAQAERPASPTSIYESPAQSNPSQATPTLPPPPASYRMAQGQTRDNGPRFYSVHKEYGIQPDAIPLPPQFFGATADLSTPNTEPLVKRTVNGTTRNVPAADDQTTQ